MPIVSRLKKKGKNYEVTFRLANQSESAHFVSEDLIVEYRLIEGKELDPNRFKLFLEAAEMDAFFQKALQYALRADRSLFEMRNYLARMDLEDTQQAKVIVKLTKMGLLNDEKLAENLVNSLFFHKHYGKEKIIFDLQKKGLSMANILQATDSIQPKAVRANLETLFDKKLKDLSENSLRNATIKMQQFLHAKGYHYQEVNRYVTEREADLKALIDEEKQIHQDFQTLSKRYQKQGFHEDQLRQKLMQALYRKGYSYQLINQTLERGK